MKSCLAACFAEGQACLLRKAREQGTGMKGRRDECDLALQQGGEMRARIGGGLEVVVSARGKEVRVEDVNRPAPGTSIGAEK